MKTRPVSVLVLAALVLAVWFSGLDRRPSDRVAALPADAEGTRLLGRLPVAFVPNLGQWEHAARYVARVGAMTVFLGPQGWTFTLVERGAKESVAVRMTFTGAGEPELVAEDWLPGRHHYLLGNDPARWRSDVPLYGAVRYRGMHPGIDVRAREHDGHFEYDLLLRPSADLMPVEIAVEGADGLRLDQEGALVMDTGLGPVRMPAPLCWEEGPAGERSLVACRYLLRGDDRFGFEVAGRRPGWALVVDPGLLWSTFLGGTGDDRAHAIALDGQGVATVAGVASSSNFPTTVGAFDASFNSGNDAFVTRLSSSGSSLVYSTFLGGSANESAVALALDAQGAATVAGETQSPDFPTTPGAFDTSFNGGIDAFITRLSPTGSSLVYSTFLGAPGSRSVIRAIALDAQGATTAAGGTNSQSFPTTPGAFDTTHNGGYDAFVTRLSADGSSLVYSTFLGGTSSDEATVLALDGQGAATIAGYTLSTGFPTTPGAFDTSYNGAGFALGDAFVTRLAPTGSSLHYSTFLGGSSDEIAQALALDAQGATTVAGASYSANFPTTPGAFDTTFNGVTDVFVTRLSAAGSSLDYSTFLGGASPDGATAIALDAQRAATVAGATASADFPTTPGAFDATHNGGTSLGDAFVARLSPTGASLYYSTFLGGTGEDAARALAIDALGAATVAGYSSSTSFPTTPGAFDTSFNGGNDAFVTRLDMLPTGVAAFGASSPGCTGPLAISVTAMPNVGNQGFALTCGNAPPSSVGVVALSAARLPTPLAVLGIDLWVSPAQLWFLPGATSNAIGAAELPLPVPQDPTLVGGRIHAQFVWVGPIAPPPCPLFGVSASNALEITIQR